MNALDYGCLGCGCADILDAAGYCGDCRGDDPDVATCRVCGCTDDAACPGGCEWADDLCSRCAA